MKKIKSIYNEKGITLIAMAIIIIIIIILGAVSVRVLTGDEDNIISQAKKAEILTELTQIEDLLTKKITTYDRLQIDYTDEDLRAYIQTEATNLYDKYFTSRILKIENGQLTEDISATREQADLIRSI